MTDRMTAQAYRLAVMPARGTSTPEADDQRDLVTWLTGRPWRKKDISRRPRIKNTVRFWHTPNGEFRHIKTAALLKSMGTQRGIPDLMFIDTAQPGCVWAIELKPAKGGRTSSDQDEWLANFAAAGWRCAVVRGLPDAQAQLQEWELVDV